eukprot:CAMPEP_0197259008 /NCGR_PEP_ID=MMETSP1429-20130617/83300_1 /TAXON_ID=49237 /ORGANISM="Chaetoceros  sp., Strain UNC1202" /LENGTH=182 /DNA_ID=CAMNT_0042723207 /DNA_START=858 /DNA_END=1406 /DNA_ORIENTATION=+
MAATTDFTSMTTLQSQNVVEPMEHQSSSTTRPFVTTTQRHGLAATGTLSSTAHVSTLTTPGPISIVPPITLSSQSLALHSEELIALHVLGGELYRSGSRENLQSLSSSCANTASTKQMDADGNDNNSHNRHNRIQTTTVRRSGVGVGNMTAMTGRGGTVAGGSPAKHSDTDSSKEDNTPMSN